MTRPMLGEPVETVPRKLVVLLTVLVLLGIVGTGASIINAQATNTASKADVDRNSALTKQLTELTEQVRAKQQTDTANTVVFREDSRRLAVATCDLLQAVAVRLQVTSPACPMLATG